MSKSLNILPSANNQRRAENLQNQVIETLSCFFCKIQSAKFFDSSTFMTYCNSCSAQLDTSRFINLEIKPMRANIHSTILSLFNSHKKSLCPERRKWIMQSLSKSSKEMLDIYHWLITYVSSSFKCINHPWIDAETIDLGKMVLFCSFCSRDYQDLLPIDANFQTIVQDAAIKIIGACDIGVLNKFILRYMQTKEISNFNSFIIEVHDIIYNTSGVAISADSRCQNCLKKLGFGDKTPIRLPCENAMHAICYGCLKDSAYQCCSLDSQIYTSNYKFEHFTQKYDFPLCCSLKKCFFNTKNKSPYKLQCYHYLCLECKNSVENPHDYYCTTCFFHSDLKNSKLDKKLMDDLAYIEVNCEDHNEQAVAFTSFGVKFYCEKCSRKDRRIPCKNIRSLKLIEEVLEKAFSLVYEKTPLSSPTYPEKLRSYINDFKILSFQEKIKTLMLMSLSSNNFSLIFDIKDTIESLKLCKSRLDYYLVKKRFERFKETYPLYMHSLKSWVVEENQANAITFKSTKYIILYGLLLGGRADTMEAYIKQISITKSNKTTTGLIFLFSLFEKLSGKVNEVNFPYEIVIEPNIDYTISVLFPPGRYFNGKPGSLNHLTDDQNSILFEISEPIYEMPFRYGGNNRIGGPILGFIYSLLSS